ncbi:MAG TPA: MBL fold metallo-hydrolase [Burkholderiaceae bacterium]
MKFASLGSGSEGNALLISTASHTSHSLFAADDAKLATPADTAAKPTTVMLDCGFGIREAQRRLARLGLSPHDLTGIVVTHEHQDHIAGVFKLARRFDIPVWLTYGTWQAAHHDSSGVELHFCRDGDAVAIGELTMLPYTVPHDAREPVQYCATDGRLKLGILTDAGQSTAHMQAALGGCDALLLECNYDPAMLANGPYPPSLKRRIAGVYGHLSNPASAAFLAELDRSKLNKVVGAHLSTKNNTPVLARGALEGVLDLAKTQVIIACQEEGFGWTPVAHLQEVQT